MQTENIFLDNILLVGSWESAHNVYVCHLKNPFLSSFNQPSIALPLKQTNNRIDNSYSAVLIKPYIAHLIASVQNL